MMKKTTVVILNYNGEKHLSTFLPTVIKNSPQAVIVVADNGSTDESLTYLNTLGDAIQIIVLDKNYGFAEGYNQALKHCLSDYYILLNSDVLVTEGWLSPLIAQLESGEHIAACQPKILSYKNKDKFEHAGASGGFMDIWRYPFCRGRVFYEAETDNNQYDDVREVFWASGACMAIKAPLFKNFGGFDSEYFAHMEEIDLCWRMKRAGYSIFATPTSVVYHVGGGTLDYYSPFKSYLNFRNSLMTIFKNESWWRLSWFFLFRLILDGVAGGMYLLKGEFRLLYTIIEAHFGFYKRIFSVLEKRRLYNQLIQQHRIGQENKVGFINKSIIFHYFLKKNRTFNNITS
jgi:GT2 family glycosyltransferase